MGITLNTADEIRIGQLAIRFLLTGEATGGALALFEFSVPSGARVPAAHSHDGYEETIYGLDGVLTWALGDREVDVAAGEVLCIPRGQVHRFDNHGESDARGLAVVTPGVLGPDYFRDVAAVVQSAAGGAPDAAALAEVMLRHGLTPAP